MDDIAIRVENLSKCYHIYNKPNDRLKQFIMPSLGRIFNKKSKQYFNEFWALKEVSFEIKKGETVGIIGLNGSGKSTLLQMICGTINPTSGSVETRGRIAALLELGSGFNPEFTGRDNVFMNASVLGLGPDEINARYDDIAAFADIGNFIEQPVKTYSSGMAVRLAFAVSVCVDPDILVIDEALAVGDAAFQFKCLERMKRLAEAGTTLLFVSHDIGMVKSFCHQVIYLEHGQEKMRGLPDVVTEQYFLDVRSEQSSSLFSGKPVLQRKNIGSSGLLAFGTDQGLIISACFLPYGERNAVVGSGDLVRIQIKVEYDSKLPDATLSVLLVDRRMLGISGRFFPLCSDIEVDGKSISTVEVEFENRFRPGNYAVTLRLESGRSEKDFITIDKQPAALSFEVMPYETSCIGAVDINIRQVEVKN